MPVFKPTALIFDMDGTLLDTEPLYTEATQKVLNPFNVQYTLPLKQRAMGGDSRRSAQMVIDHYQLPLTVNAYLQQREQYLLESFPAAAEMPGAADFIKVLTSTHIKLGLATSSYRHLYEIKMVHRDWNLFHTIVCGDDPELSRSKPHPDIFLLCAKRLGVTPEACIAFEDSANGIQAALAAGMKVFAIDSPHVAPDALAGAETVFQHYAELHQLLASWY